MPAPTLYLYFYGINDFLEGKFDHYRTNKDGKREALYDFPFTFTGDGWKHPDGTCYEKGKEYIMHRYFNRHHEWVEAKTELAHETN